MSFGVAYFLIIIIICALSSRHRIVVCVRGRVFVEWHGICGGVGWLPCFYLLNRVGVGGAGSAGATPAASPVGYVRAVTLQL
ncbi:hypothetical protein TRSC58_07370 [Trypanosoma rangeli SC58]|uniref:Uncharacterized protein n=1 Tax=Trypanosoma rangeli SC58 TaxID=429131 RepID=A0A061IRN0_TRYRA|nr:hypothetical protein TRSC58_07370 [Trypanosoma rangeli SC58]